MSNWKIAPKTNKKWIPFIKQLHRAVFDGNDKITSLPAFEQVIDEGVLSVKGLGEARKIKVVYHGTEYELALHFYNRHNGNCLAVKNLEDGKNLIQLVLDKFLKETPKGIQIWHDGVITGVANLNAAVFIDYIKQQEPKLLKTEDNRTIIKLGVLNEEEILTNNNTAFIKFISSLLLFAVMRQEIKKIYKFGNSDIPATSKNNTMNIFFGKISKTTNPRQFSEGFYETAFPEMFNGIDVGDYCYIIADSKIQLWKARAWSDNRLRLDFDIIIPDLNINTKYLTALKFFQLNVQFVVLTVRQSPNAFYRLTLFKDITESQLTDAATYADGNNYRKIILQDNNNIDSNSEDIHLYYTNGRLNMHRPSFFSPDFFNSFIDNTIKIGLGQKNKDKTLRLIQSATNFPRAFNPQEISILNLYDAFGVKYEEDETMISTPNDDNMKPPALNQILFGPPGTGKTFNTINEALKIIDPKFYVENQKDRKKLTDRFKELLIKKNDENNGQIAFCTFHQSFSYEDFVEGIKPLKPSTADTFLKYDIEDGIFKRICNLAEGNNSTVKVIKEGKVSWTEDYFSKASFYKISLGDANNPEDREIYEYCRDNNYISIGFGGENDFSGLNESQINDKCKDLDFPNSYAQSLNYFIHYLKTGNYVLVSNGNKNVRALGKVVGNYEYIPDSPISYNHFRKVEWLFKDENIPVEEIYDRGFSQKTIYKIDEDGLKKDFFTNQGQQQVIENKEDKKYVIIIDEINRGNVSAIFGELITLIEKDKRAGKPEELEVTLPYSKAPFKVPANVYIIGTMNTADRSIEALDTALRRRFSFIEFPPLPNLIKSEEASGKVNGMVDGIDLEKLLITINTRIEKLIDKDHRIGHSYFLKVNDDKSLRYAFKNEIIPLLEEYFFGDFGKIGLVLGSSFIELVNHDFNFAEFKEYDNDVQSDLKEKQVFRIKAENQWDFTKI